MNSECLHLKIHFTILYKIKRQYMKVIKESKSLKEDTLGYLMTKMTSNNGWIPYVHLINKKDFSLNINYSGIICNIPFISHSLGYYSKV